MDTPFRTVSFLVSVRSFDHAYRWYGDFFGVPGKVLAEDSALWVIGGTTIQVAQEESAAHAGRGTLLLETVDLKGLVARLPFAPRVGLRHFGRIAVAEFRDPDGNRLVVTETTPVTDDSTPNAL